MTRDLHKFWGGLEEVLTYRATNCRKNARRHSTSFGTK